MHLEAVVHAHAAAFLGRLPWEVAQDEALLADAHATAGRCYRHRMIIAAMDPFAAVLECSGLALQPAEGDPCRFEVVAPVHGSIEELKGVPEVLPLSTPLLRASLGAARRLAPAFPNGIAVPIAGPLTLASGLLGAETIKDVLETNPAALAAALLTLARRLHPLLHAIGATGARVAICELPFHADFIPAAAFCEFVTPALALLAAESREATCAAPALLIEGNTTPIAAALCATGADLVVCPAGADAVTFLEEAKRFPEVTVRLDVATGLWRNGCWPEVCQAVAAARPAARRHPSTILATGPLPYSASSVMVVDACSFAANMDPWIEVS